MLVRYMKKNFEKVFRVFEKNYVLVPLEVFGKNPYKTLVSTVLSSRTKDETTLEASKRLFKKAPDLKALSKMETVQIEKLQHAFQFCKRIGFIRLFGRCDDFWCL